MWGGVGRGGEGLLQQGCCEGPVGGLAHPQQCERLPALCQVAALLSAWLVEEFIARVPFRHSVPEAAVSLEPALPPVGSDGAKRAERPSRGPPEGNPQRQRIAAQDLQAQPRESRESALALLRGNEALWPVTLRLLTAYGPGEEGNPRRDFPRPVTWSNGLEGPSRPSDAFSRRRSDPCWGAALLLPTRGPRPLASGHSETDLPAGTECPRVPPDLFTLFPAAGAADSGSGTGLRGEVSFQNSFHPK